MQKASAAVGSAVFFALAPGTVAGVIPLLVALANPTEPLPYGWSVRAIGIALIVLGASFLVHAFARFVRQGLGTPAPVAPTQHLVVTGIYRYVRNPMYLAVWTTILGQAILFANWGIVVYLVIAAATMITFVTAYEQPTLRRTFGQEYADYCRAVPAWIPRLTPTDWQPRTSKA